MSNDIKTGTPTRDVKEVIEMEPMLTTGTQEKVTRFQVNKVKNESMERGVKVAVNMSADEETTDEELDDVHSATDRTRLNSESETKYAKSFRLVKKK